MRHARALHPRGVVAEGTWTVLEPASALGLSLGLGSRPARARLSRGLGLPPPLPDVRGLAVRIGDDEPLDLLLSTLGRTYSTLLPYQTPYGRVMIGARRVPVRGRELRFDFAERSNGPWRVVARLDLAAPRGDEAIAFDPYLHAHPELRPTGLLSDIREAAYSGSRRGRGR